MPCMEYPTSENEIQQDALERLYPDGEWTKTVAPYTVICLRCKCAIEPQTHFWWNGRRWASCHPGCAGVLAKRVHGDRSD